MFAYFPKDEQVRDFQRSANHVHDNFSNVYWHCEECGEI